MTKDLRLECTSSVLNSRYLYEYCTYLFALIVFVFIAFQLSEMADPRVSQWFYAQDQVLKTCFYKN